MKLVDDAIDGTYNVVTPPGDHTMGELVDACCRATGYDLQPVWVDAEFLAEHEVRAWNDLPLWVAPGSPLAGIPHCDPQRAVDAGLTFTELQTTVDDTLEWFREDRGDDLTAGISEEREAKLLAAYEEDGGTPTSGRRG